MSDQTQTTQQQTKPTEAAKPQKLVKIKTIHPIRLMRPEGELTVVEGQVVQVTEEEAAMFCDTKFDIGHKDFSGYGSGQTTKVVRAQRV